MIRSSENVSLNESERLLIKNGWGKNVLEDIELKKITYSSDGYVVDGYYALPATKVGKYPLIVWNRGGDEKSGRLDDFLAWGILGEIASWGYIVIASQYRDKDQFGGDEINDVTNIIKIGMQVPYFDGENVGVEGWSRGGMMTYKILTKVNFLKCAIIVAGLANLERNIDFNKKLKSKIYRKFSEDKLAEFLSDRSAVKFYDRISKEIPIVLIHGTEDDKVSYEDSVEIYNLLKSNGKENIELFLIEGGDHYLRKKRKYVSELRKNQFDRYLKLKT